ncbi:hypothetical protein FOPG_14938 [Fusarium oxysporum f. sp. conglutinans race 2 54008]|uniref:Chromo domain-containing protein n=1 Tax=Fusarium oxysporum f. sp. conglutinans race 2 54008 TaxID=1089457 RepID=X0H028_FUSOX|nr:hypothetical protein FOPG_14938 [Fusarium oxysporum f. sp. conglutinans race 2 54008]KAG6979611.1 hypothetical protein FocnCong_v010019 [Fusarium oxysporum f. sp. conglutinans]KAI8402603.1 hypothetical protein FOFC_17918 [Fusarium oxysporum]
MAANNQTNQQFEIDCFVGYRVNRRERTVKILVKWADHSEPTWEPEAVLQETAGRTLYSYWSDRGGRGRATRLREFHVFRILAKGWDRGQWRFHCQWVGYSTSGDDTTWEPESKVMRIAPAAVAEWDASQAAANQAVPNQAATNQASANQNAPAANP